MNADNLPGSNPPPEPEVSESQVEGTGNPNASDSADIGSMGTGRLEMPAAVRYDMALQGSLTTAESAAGIEPKLAATLRLLHHALRPSEESHTAPGTAVPQTPADIPFLRLLPERFRIQRLLGKGGFGCVYLASDNVLQREVAIKIPHQGHGGSDELRVRFLRESRALARLNHPSIVRIMDSGESGSFAWQVAEYVAGPRLSEFRRKQGGTLKPREAAWTVRQLADAVQHAHDHGVLHRDIKPDNVLLESVLPESHSESSDGPPDPVRRVPRLTDFGLARLMDDDVAVSRSGTLIGTPRYMAPEQLVGNISAQGPWTDIYSLGMVLYELLTGNVPSPEADSLHARIAAAERPVRSFRDRRREISRDLETICLKCLQYRPQDRYASAGALRDDLTRYLDGRSTLARPLPVYEQFMRWSGRNRLLASSLCLLIVAVGIVLGQAVRNEHLSRKQNQNLETTLLQLTAEKQRSDTLLNLAEKSRVSAEQSESSFRTLAWNTTIRECLTELQQKTFRSARDLLDLLARSQPEQVQRPEWQLISQELQRHYQPVLEAGHPIYELTAVPGTTLLAAAGESRSILLIDTLTFQQVRTILTDITAIHAIAVSGDGKRIAVGGVTAADDIAVPMIYSLETGDHLQSLPAQKTTIESLMFSADGNYLVCGCRYEPVSVFNLATGAESQLPTARRNLWLAASPDSQQLVAQSTADTVVISSFEDVRSSRQISAGDDVEFCVWIPESRILACTEYQSRSVELIHLDTGNHVGRLSHSGKEFTSIAASHSERRIYAGRIDGSIATWELPESWFATAPSSVSASGSGSQIPELAVTETAQVDNQPLSGLVVLNQVLYCSTANGRVSAMPVPGRSEKETAGGPDDVVWYSAAIDREGGLLLGRKDGRILEVRSSDWMLPGTHMTNFRELAERNLVRELTQDNYAIDAVAVSADRKLLGWSNWIESVRLQSMATGAARTVRDVAGRTNGGVDIVCFSPDSQRIAWTGKEKTLFSSEAHEAAELQSVRLPGYGNVVRYSPDSALLACGGSSDELVVYDSMSMTAKRTFSHCSGCTAIEWLSSGQSLLLGFGDGSIQVRSLIDDSVSPRVFVHRHEVRSIAVSLDETLGVSADSLGQVAMWDIRTGNLLGILLDSPHQNTDQVVMKPVLRTLDSGQLILVRDGGDDGPKIFTWQTVPETVPDSE